MSASRRSALFLALLLPSALVPAAAQRRNAPSLTVTVLDVTAAADKASAGREVHPNDVVRYTLTFTNRAAKPVANVELRNAIPAGVHFMPGSAHTSRSDARLEFSADGGKHWSAEPMEAAMVGGESVNQRVPVARYTHIRWVLPRPVAPSDVVTADFEAKVGAGS